MTTYSFRAPPDVQRIVEAALAAREGEPAAGRHGVTGSRAAVIGDLVRAGAKVTGPDGRGVEPRWRLVDVEPECWALDGDPDVRLHVTDWNEWTLTAPWLPEPMRHLSMEGGEGASTWATRVLQDRALEILAAVGLGGGQ